MKTDEIFSDKLIDSFRRQLIDSLEKERDKIKKIAWNDDEPDIRDVVLHLFLVASYLLDSVEFSTWESSKEQKDRENLRAERDDKK